MGIKGRAVAKPAGARDLGATLYELEPGASGFNLHAHYANEELFVVLSGKPTLRTLDGEQELEPGDVVACPTGRDGTHTIANRSAERVRILAVSTTRWPEIVIYPELDTVGVATRPPFEPVPEGSDEGIVGLFDRSANTRRA